MADHELLLRCDCGGHPAAIDVWVKPGADPVPKGAPISGTYEVSEIEEAYLTFYEEIGPTSWRERFAYAWTMLRGRSRTFGCVILNPRDVERLRDFLNRGEGTDSHPPPLA